MREAVQDGADEVDVVDVADVVVDPVRSAKTRGANKAIVAQKGMIVIIASVDKKRNWAGGSSFKRGVLGDLSEKG